MRVLFAETLIAISDESEPADLRYGVASVVGGVVDFARRLDGAIDWFVVLAVCRLHAISGGIWAGCVGRSHHLHTGAASAPSAQTTTPAQTATSAQSETKLYSEKNIIFTELASARDKE